VHELGVVMNIVEQVEDIIREQNLYEVDSLVLQIGELSSMVPHYVEACYPAAVSGTLLETTKLVIEVVPALARCRVCGTDFRPVPPVSSCPVCASPRTDLLSGREFVIKELRL
jgi:hydrogenase nickel incorporation protein HypA/HybF